jgi:hypothetical protein
MIHVLLAALLPSLQTDADVRARFQTLHVKNDREGCAALWREKPSLALPTIERDLDEALELREKAKEPDVAAIRALEERAGWGARIAREALGAPLIADLAFARAGWTERDRKLFRDERAIHARALAWIEKGENRNGLEAAQETVTRALALGDWHGAAMGYETSAIAHQALSAIDDAIVAWSQARVIYRELALANNEYVCLRNVLDMCYAADRTSRGREAADQAIVLARARGDRTAEAEFLVRRAGFEEKLGLRTEAEATRKAAQALKK